jgi:RNA polymerase sigma-70 factor (ECF subfamily)
MATSTNSSASSVGWSVGSRVSKHPIPLRRTLPPAARGTVPVRSDREIVAGLGRGEAWAAEELYDRVQPHVERTLRRVLRQGGADFEDLMQASFERIIRVLTERSLGGACNLASWSSAVAAHVALDALRRRVRERRIFYPDQAPDLQRGPDATPERNLEGRLEVARLQGIFGRMKLKHAEAVLLHDVLGHDLAEVAEITGVTVAAAQSRLVRGRGELMRRAKADGRAS